MDNWVVVGLSVVMLSDCVMSRGLSEIVGGPFVHGRASSFVIVMLAVVVVGGLGMLLLVAVSLGVSVLGMSSLVMLVSLMDLGVLVSVMSVKGQGLVSITMLNAVLGRCLDLVEELIVLMLDVVHHLGASVVADIVFICVARVVGVSSRVVSEIFIAFVLVIVVVPSPERCAFVVLWVLIVAALMVIALVVFGAEVLMLVMFVMVRSGVAFTVIHGVLVLSQVRRVQGKLIVSVVGVVMVAVVIVVSLFFDVFVVDLSLGISLMESSVLVGPKKLLVAGQHWHIFFLQDSVLKTVVAVSDFLMGHLIVLHVSRLIVRVSVLIRSLIEVTDFRSTSDR